MMNGWDWLWGSVMMLAFWGGLAAVVVWATRAFATRPGDPGRQGGAPDAEEILRARFARGEISEDEFDARMNVLTGRSA